MHHLSLVILQHFTTSVYWKAVHDIMMKINNMKCEQHTAAGMLHGTLTKVYVKDYQSSMQQHSIVDFTLSRG